MVENSVERDPSIKKLKEVLSLPLSIPEYQRPYKWSASTHVRQLLEDLLREASNGKEYRIGSLIIHYEKANDISEAVEKYNIVDGQQRLVTLSLLLHVLGFKGNTTLLSQRFTHVVSKNNIKYNYSFIKDFIHKTAPDKKEMLSNYLLNHCSFAIIEVSHLSEAFQLFDSQNGRGKKLDPSDLLKAYHLREMYENSEEEKRICVKNWERAVDGYELNTVIGTNLYRIRSWSRHEMNYFFTEQNISAFKGLNVIRSIRLGKSYPYLKAMLPKINTSVFTINDPIINGKHFFNYVNHYAHLNKGILAFVNNQNMHGLNFDYPNSNRNSGDIKLKNLYKSLLLFYVDKFGMEDVDFVAFSKEIYRWVYQKRLIHSKISEKTILQELIKDNLIVYLDKWYYPDIANLRLRIKSLDQIDIKKQNVDKIIDCIKKLENNG